MRGSFRVDQLAEIARAPFNGYGGPWFLLKIPGRHIVPSFARRSWWTWVPKGAEVFAMAEVVS